MVKKKKDFNRNILIASVILILLFAVFYYGISQSVFQGIVIGTANIDSFDGRYIYIPFGGSAPNANNGESFVVEIVNPTTALDKDTCEMIGWKWDTQNLFCRPTDSLKNYDYTISLACSGSLCNADIPETGYFDGTKIAMVPGQCPLYPGPSLGTLRCNGIVKVDVLPPECNTGELDCVQFRQCTNSQWVELEDLSQCGVECTADSMCASDERCIINVWKCQKLEDTTSSSTSSSSSTTETVIQNTTSPTTTGIGVTPKITIEQPAKVLERNIIIMIFVGIILLIVILVILFRKFGILNGKKKRR